MAANRYTFIVLYARGGPRGGPVREAVVEATGGTPHAARRALVRQLRGDGYRVVKVVLDPLSDKDGSYENC